MAGVLALALVPLVGAGPGGASVTQPPLSAAPTPPRGPDAPVWAPPTIRAYWVNRYIDPASSRLMHGQHWLYSIEEDGRWILRPQPAGAAAVTAKAGPARRSRGYREDRAALQLNELGAEIARLREENKKAGQNAIATNAALTAITTTGQELAAAAKGAQASLAGVDAMRAEIRALKEQLAALKAAAKEKDKEKEK